MNSIYYKKTKRKHFIQKSIENGFASGQSVCLRLKTIISRNVEIAHYLILYSAGNRLDIERGFFIHIMVYNFAKQSFPHISYCNKLDVS